MNLQQDFLFGSLDVYNEGECIARRYSFINCFWFCPCPWSIGCLRRCNSVRKYARFINLKFKSHKCGGAHIVSLFYVDSDFLKFIQVC